jgi:hypothetical protein
MLSIAHISFCPFAFYHQRGASRELKAPKKTAPKKKADADPPKKKPAAAKKFVEHVREADPWEQTLAVAETADATDNSAATTSVGSQWLLMTVPMFYLN